MPITSPKLVRAVDASDAPVPPSATVISVIPVTDPPVIDIAFDSCVAIDPKPSDVRAVAPDSTIQLLPSATIKLPSPTASPLIVVRVAS